MSLVESVRHFLSRIQPPSLFLFLALTFGLTVLAANPPFQSADEYEHFFRAFQLSQGTVIALKSGETVGGMLPALVNNVAQTEGIPFHPEKKMTSAIFRRKLKPLWVEWNSSPASSPVMFISFPHTAVYAPSGYLPQTVALVIGKLLRIGPLGMMYFARLAGFSAALCLGYAALNIVPIYRWSMMLVLLCPTNLYLMGSVAPDGILIGGAFLLVALLARMTLEPDHAVPLSERTAILILAGMLATAKFVYLPLTAAAFLLAFPNLGSYWQKATFGAACVVFCVVPTWVWCHVVSLLYVPGRTDIPIDPVAQLQVIKHAPLGFLVLIARTIKMDYWTNYRSVVALMGWADTYAPSWYYPVYGCGLLGCLTLESDFARFVLPWQRLVLLGTAISGAGLIYVTEYLIWNSPGSRASMQGISGRYFLPLAPLVLLSFPPVMGPKARERWAIAVGSLMGTISAAVCLWSVVARYYIVSLRS